MLLKPVAIVVLSLSLVGLVGCPGGSNNNNPTVAAVPTQVCGTNIPPQYCQPYSPGMTNPYYPTGYPYTPGYPYGPSYPGFGYGSTQPFYPTAAPYGCNTGFQPLYTGTVWPGTSFTCLQVSYLNTWGYTPYYPSNFTWPGGYTGYGPLQACDSYVPGSCGYFGAACVPAFGQRFGYCVRSF